jgi:hypothetical protein
MLERRSGDEYLVLIETAGLRELACDMCLLTAPLLAVGTRTTETLRGWKYSPTPGTPLTFFRHVTECRFRGARMERNGDAQGA